MANEKLRWRLTSLKPATDDAYKLVNVEWEDKDGVIRLVDQIMLPVEADDNEIKAALRERRQDAERLAGMGVELTTELTVEEPDMEPGSATIRNVDEEKAHARRVRDRERKAKARAKNRKRVDVYDQVEGRDEHGEVVSGVER